MWLEQLDRKTIHNMTDEQLNNILRQLGKFIDTPDYNKAGIVRDLILTEQWDRSVHLWA